MKNINVLELFSGIGSFQQALKKENIHFNITHYSSEIDKWCLNFKKIVFNDKSKELGDILNYQNWNIPRIDVMCWTPPCTSFSSAGKQQGTETPDGRLFYKGIDVIYKYQPKIIFFENVKALRNKFFNVYESYLLFLGKNDYKYKTIIINAKDHLDIPQNRERLFIVAWKDKYYQWQDRENMWLMNKWNNEKNYTLKKYLELENNSFSNCEKIPVNWKENAYSFYKNGNMTKYWKISAYCGTITAFLTPWITDDTYKRKLTGVECLELMGWYEKKILNKMKAQTEIKDYKIAEIAGRSVVVQAWNRLLENVKWDQFENE